jgi:hypothetical protein
MIIEESRSKDYADTPRQKKKLEFQCNCDHKNDKDGGGESGDKFERPVMKAGNHHQIYHIIPQPLTFDSTITFLLCVSFNASFIIIIY